MNSGLPPQSCPPLSENLSRIFIGQVSHRREQPKKHDLRYSLYLFLVDLDELPSLSQKFFWFGYNRHRLFSIFDQDYLTTDPAKLPWSRPEDGLPTASTLAANSKSSLSRCPFQQRVRNSGDCHPNNPKSLSIRERLKLILASQGFNEPIGRVLLLTAPRLLWPVFNPVSFYYIYSPHGELRAHLAEINNTFGERHYYLLPADERVESSAPPFQYSRAKEFHVSPFNDMLGEYQFCFEELLAGEFAGGPQQDRLQELRQEATHIAVKQADQAQTGCVRPRLTIRLDVVRTPDQPLLACPIKNNFIGSGAFKRTEGREPVSKNEPASIEKDLRKTKTVMKEELTADGLWQPVSEDSHFFKTELKGELLPLCGANLLKAMLSGSLVSPLLSMPRILWEAGKLAWGKN